MSEINILLHKSTVKFLNCKVRTLWETHKIWKNLSHGFDKSADLLNKRQNHEEDFFQIMCASQKVQTLWANKNSSNRGIAPLKNNDIG